MLVLFVVIANEEFEGRFLCVTVEVASTTTYQFEIPQVRAPSEL